MRRLPTRAAHLFLFRSSGSAALDADAMNACACVCAMLPPLYSYANMQEMVARYRCGGFQPERPTSFSLALPAVLLSMLTR